MDYILSTANLMKQYGKNTVVNAVNLHVRQGEIYGLIGKNGAGKTTFLKMAGVIVGILVSANMLSVIYTMINLLVEKVLPNANFDSTLYTIEYYLGSYGAGASSGDTARAVAVALIYGVLAAIAAAWIMRKRDVV